MADSELWNVPERMFGGIELDKVQSVNYQVHMSVPTSTLNQLLVLPVLRGGVIASRYNAGASRRSEAMSTKSIL